MKIKIREDRLPTAKYLSFWVKGRGNILIGFTFLCVLFLFRKVFLFKNLKNLENKIKVRIAKSPMRIISFRARTATSITTCIM